MLQWLCIGISVQDLLKRSIKMHLKWSSVNVIYHTCVSTDLETSLFGSSYIPSFYYGLSLRLKL